MSRRRCGARWNWQNREPKTRPVDEMNTPSRSRQSLTKNDKNIDARSVFPCPMQCLNCQKSKELGAVSSPAIGDWGTCPSRLCKFMDMSIYKLSNYNCACRVTACTTPGQLRAYLASIRGRGSWRRHISLLLVA